jgi:hypothetical protein
MPGSKLVNLKTDLKSLKYGHDRQGNGNSGQPYITTPIPNRLSTSPFDDGYIRGGMTAADKASKEDLLRISKFFNDKPKGSLFIARQVKLQFSNPKLEVKKFRTNNTGFGIFDGVVNLGASIFNVVNELAPGPTRLYNKGINTLKQVDNNAFGQHFNRHGILPVQDDNTKYYAVVKYNNENGSNRLVGLKNKLIKVVEPPSNFLNSVNWLLSNVNAIFNTNLSARGLQAPELTIDSYLGGPGSSYGQGQTLIRRFDITSNGYNKQQPTARGVKNYSGTLGVTKKYFNDTTPNTTGILGALNNLVVSIASGAANGSFPQVNQTAVDYKGGLPAGNNGTINSPTTRNYQNLVNAISKNKALSINTNTGRAKGLNPTATSYQYYGKRKLSANDKTIALYDNSLEFERYDPDIMTIVFQAIDPFGADLTTGYHFHFPAYIKGFKDNFDATWNEYNYSGRAESFYTYGKFKRNVSFGFDIPCFNKTQLYEKHRALGQLASTTAGSYNNGLLGGVLLKVKVGGYLNNEYAILNNISYDIPDDSSWELDGTGTTTNESINKRNQLAMYLKVNVSLTIIHNSLPQYKVPDVKGNEKAGFFGHISNPIARGFLPTKYKTTEKFT